jgi:transcriptional regulator with XRE-family HTH domain
MTTYQKQFLNELAAGHDGPRIPASKLAYFQERLRGRIFEFILARFLAEQQNGLTQAKLARRIGKTSDVVNRWLGAPSNLTVDTISDLLIGIGAEEPILSSSSVLNRPPVNYSHLDDLPSIAESADQSAPSQRAGATALESGTPPPQQGVSTAKAAAT